jgi:hypothetical protein
MGNITTLQGELNLNKKVDCVLDNGRIIPCAYHKDRANNALFAIREIATKKQESYDSGIIYPSTEFIKLAKKFQQGQRAPAGGWYLVKEQRDWLRNSIFEIVRTKKGRKTIRVLEAGSAGYIHHFTYLSIINEVLAILGDDFNLEVTVVDKCLFPLLTIEIIINNMAKLRDNTKLDVAGYSFEVDGDLITFLLDHRLIGSPQLKLNVVNCNLADEQNIKALGKFDVVTEHFLTAVIENFDTIERVRNGYSSLIEDGGYLLCAGGITRGTNKDAYFRFLRMHEANKFQLIEEELVWDPYGIVREDLLSLLNNESVRVPFDNTMFKFKKV